MRAGARIASGPRRAVLDREGPETAQLDPIAARHRRSDLAENGVDDIFHVTLIEMRVLRSDALHELGLDHRWCVLGLPDRIGPALIRDWRVPKGQETVKVETLDRLHRAPLLQAACE